MERSSAESWPTVFSNLKSSHDEAYRLIEKALKLDEERKTDEAIAQYEAGLLIIDKALNISIECFRQVDETWENACAMIQKMRKTKKEILSRIADSQRSIEPNMNISTLPPTYDEAVSSMSNSLVSPSSIQTYSELGEALQNLKVETGAQTAHILYTCPNVQVYFISASGTVTATSEPDTLNIVELESDGEGETPKAYLQVGNWIYPLVPGVSPCFRTDYGAFILPDLHSSEEGAAVGFILPKDADSSVYELLNDILYGIAQAVPEPFVEPRGARTRRGAGFSISEGIVKGAQYISKGMVFGATKAGELINYGTPKLMNNITPAETPSQINPKVQTGIKVAKNVTETAVSFTGFIASKVGCATMALGRYLAPHIQRQGTRLLSTTCNYSEQDASQKVGSVLEVAAGAVEGFATVYDGLENAAKILGSSLATNTVKVVQHKYGQPAGEATGDTFETVGNVFVAGHNIKYLTPKGLVKDTAKQTGKAVVQDYHTLIQTNKFPSHSNAGSSEVD